MKTYKLCPTLILDISYFLSQDLENVLTILFTVFIINFSEKFFKNFF